MDNDYKPKVVFTFVKAGMGHVTPATEIYEAFMKKYGDKCNVCKSYIFSESTNPAVQKLGVIQDEHVKKLSTSKVYNKLEGFSYCLGSPLTLFGLDFFLS